ncbi:hypothetical protein AaE_015198, partial [Aphanomyces astaci]
CGCDESFTTRLLALRHSNACAPKAAPTPSPLRPFVSHAVRAAFPAVPALTAALAEVAADEECTNQNNTTLAVAPPLASRFAASGAGIPPQPCVSTLAVDHAVPTASPARPLLSCPTCSRAFPSKRSLAQHARACTSGGSIAAKHPRLGPPRVPPTLPVDIAPEFPVAAPAPVTFVLRTDGGCRDNGATAQASNSGGAGSALFAPDGTVVWTLQHWLPSGATNNVAEYQALLNGLQGVLHWRLPTLRIECDSQLVLSQVSGNARVSLPLLRSLRNRVLKALAHLRHKGTFTSLHHIPRNENTVADALANAAMDLKETSYECHCQHPAITCVPLALRPALTRSVLPHPVPALVWSFASGALVSRSDPNAPQRAAGRALARARLLGASSSSQPLSSAPVLTPPPSEALATSQLVQPHQLGVLSSSPPLSLAPAQTPPPSDALAQSQQLPLAASSSSPPLSTAPVTTPPPNDVDQQLQVALPSVIVAAAAPATTTTPSQRGEVLPNPVETPVQISLAAAALLDSIIAAIEPPLAAPAHDPTTRQQRLVVPTVLPPTVVEVMDLALSALVTTTTARLDDSDSWTTAEPIMAAFPAALTRVLLDSLGDLRPPPPSTSRAASSAAASRRPIPLVTTVQLDHRREEAQAHLHEVQASAESNRRQVYRARRKLGRLNKAHARAHLRHLFVTNEKRCVESIFRQANGLSPKSMSCAIPTDDLVKHFAATNRPPVAFDPQRPSGDKFLGLLDALPPADFNGQVFVDAITMDEVEDALNAANLTSAPGLDGLPYRIYYRFRLALLPLLHAIYNKCWSTKRVPAAWKVSVTELIFKKGDPSQASNWRPLALQNTLYKLYASILKTRFTLWLDSNERLTNSQKGFRKFNGCHEHNFLAQAMMDTIRRSKSPFFAVWYDLRNAFGAMPHDFLWLVLSRLGVSPDFLAIVQDIYTDASTMVSAASGVCPPIDQLCGVFQGCPLSPLLFIAGMTPLMMALDAQAPAHGVKVAADVNLSTTAFADDIKIFSRTPSGIQGLHATVVDFLDWSTMAANPSKCAFLAVTYKDSKQVPSDLTLAINGVALPKLSLADSYCYLGIREGFDHVHTRFQLTDKLASMRQQVVALVKSPLAPWQIIKAIKVFVMSQLEFAIRHVKATKSQLQGFSTFLAKSLRHLLRLPTNSTKEFFYSPPSSGGLGFLPLDESRQASTLAHAFQMLNSPDDAIQRLCRAQLRAIILLRFHVDAAALDAGGDLMLQRFLNGTLQEQPIASLKTQHADISSVWTDVVATLRQYNLRLQTRGDDHFDIKFPHMAKSATTKNIAREMKMHIKLGHALAWSKQTDQGRTTMLHGRDGSKFLLSGGKLWDADYRFGIAARLNQVDTRSVLKRKRLRSNGACRHCGQVAPETLAHVLQRCPHNEVSIRARHDAALGAISRTIQAALPKATLLVNATLPGYDGPTLKPDLQLIDQDKKTAIICDLAIAHEDDQLHDGDTVFEKTAKGKMDKYSPLSRHLVRQGFEVYSCALVYGSLGSVAPANHNILTAVIGLSRPAASKLQYGLSADIIKSSRTIWNTHCSGPKP